MIDHPEASELLGPYARDELGAPERAQVETHLASCGECSSELVAVRALLEPVGEPGLTDIERARLERAVTAAMAAPQTAEVIASPTSRWPKIASALGAAAMLALIAVGLTQVDLGDSASNDSASGSGVESSEERASVEVGGPDIDQEAAQDIALEDSQGGAAEGTAKSGGPSIAARFDPDAGSFKTKDLKVFAATQPPFRTFASTFEAGDAGGLQDAYLDAISSAAPTEEGKRLLRTCALQVMEQDFPIVPAYGAYGTFDGRDVLVLGFVSARSDRARLNRYVVWVWPRESCTTPVKVITGRVMR